jgi:hypothetical protein
MMLIYQYIYYAIRESDKSAGLSTIFTKSKAAALCAGVETFWLVTIWAWIDLMGGRPLHKMPVPALLLALFIFVLWYINFRLLGPEGRIQRYKKHFDDWDERKRKRWNYYIASVVLLTLAASFIVIEFRRGL